MGVCGGSDSSSSCDHRGWFWFLPFLPGRGGWYMASRGRASSKKKRNRCKMWPQDKGIKSSLLLGKTFCCSARAWVLKGKEGKNKIPQIVFDLLVSPDLSHTSGTKYGSNRNIIPKLGKQDKGKGLRNTLSKFRERGKKKWTIPLSLSLFRRIWESPMKQKVKWGKKGGRGRTFFGLLNEKKAANQIAPSFSFFSSGRAWYGY